MASGPSIIATLGLDTKPMQSGLDRAKGMMGKFAGAFGVGLGVGGIMAAARSVIEFGDALNDQASALDLTTTRWQQLVGAFDDTKPDQLAKAMMHLTQKVSEARSGSAEAVNDFKRLGVTWEDINQLSPDEILMKMSDAMKDSKSPTEALAAAIDILGKSGRSMIPNLKEGSDEIARMGEEANIASEKSLAAADRISRKWTTTMNGLKAAALNLMDTQIVREFFGERTSSVKASQTEEEAMAANRAEAKALGVTPAKAVGDSFNKDLPLSPDQKKAMEAEVEDAIRVGKEELRKAEIVAKSIDRQRQYDEEELAKEKEVTAEIAKQEAAANRKIGAEKQAAMDQAEAEFMADPTMKGEHARQREDRKQERLKQRFKDRLAHEQREDDRRARTGVKRHGRPDLFDRAQKNFEAERAKILGDLKASVTNIEAALKGKFANE